MYIASLGSGSKGNTFYININGMNILIDVGLSMKKIYEKLIINIGIDIEEIDLIFITHKHDDHSKSIFTILKSYPHIKYIMPREVYKDILKKFKKEIPKENLVIADAGYWFKGNAIDVKPIHVNHDAVNFAYKIIDKYNGESLLHLPDNGGIKTKKLKEEFTGCDYYNIESNHDLTMQIFSKRSTLLKRRVLSYYGHTHNAEAIELLFQIMRENFKGVLFHHLSEECNTPELARETHESLIEIWGNKTQFKNARIAYATQNDFVEL